MKKGKVAQVRGVIVDVQFEPENTPMVYEALEITNNKSKLILEVQAIIGDGMVKTIAMGTTYGLSRGVEVTSLGHQIEVPIGEETLGRMFNVLGEPIDNLGAIKTKQKSNIHKS